jgi:hypothetical protein
MPTLPALKLPTHHVRKTPPGDYEAGYYDSAHKWHPTLTGVDLPGATLFAAAVNASTITVTVRRPA